MRSWQQKQAKEQGANSGDAPKPAHKQFEEAPKAAPKVRSIFLTD